MFHLQWTTLAYIWIIKLPRLYFSLSYNLPVQHSEVTAGEGTDQGRNVTVEMDDVPLFLRGGYILPTQVPGHKNTMDRCAVLR